MYKVLLEKYKLKHLKYSKNITFIDPHWAPAPSRASRLALEGDCMRRDECHEASSTARKWL